MTFSKVTWKNLRGFEDTYEISSKGCIRSKDHVVQVIDRYGRVSYRIYSGRMIQPFRRGGRLKVRLRVDASRARVIKNVAELVALTFIPDYDPDLDTISYKNFDPDDCCVTNLRIEHLLY